MSRSFPALDLVWSQEPSELDVDLTLARLDDWRPTAVERLPCTVRVFFASLDDRDRAGASATDLPGVQVTCLLVPDEAWAERSQASLTAVRVGRIVVTPPWLPAAPVGDDVVIVIQPSMGFGTGHHASTRLCLALLQRHVRDHDRAIDVGTGSGVLAIAARRLGASVVDAIDSDRDAVNNARENVALNGESAGVAVRVADITEEPAGGGYDIMTANLTGAMLINHARRLTSEVRSGGTMILSGFQTDECDRVAAAFQAVGARVSDLVSEDGWTAASLVTT